MINGISKRLFDLSFSALGVIVLSPVLLAVALGVLIASGRPLLYRGPRTGRHGRPFLMLKFRTMVADADRIGGTSTAENDPRITAAGALLRRFKLDELPQLFNVIKGDMSIVGPRPEVAEYTDLYDDDERLILQVRPGITDFSSIKFRHLNAILAESGDPDKYYRDVIRPQKNRLRLDYAKNNNFFLDLKIVFLTLMIMMNRKNSYHRSWNI